MSELTDKLDGFRAQLEELDKRLSGEALNDMKLYKTLMQERSHLAPVVDKLSEMKETEREIEDSKEIIKAEEDPELVEMAKEELSALEEKYAKAEKESQASQASEDTRRLSSQSPARMYTAHCDSSLEYTGYRESRRRNPVEESIPLQSQSQCFRKRKRLISR